MIGKNETYDQKIAMARLLRLQAKAARNNVEKNRKANEAAKLEAEARSQRNRDLSNGS